jgi:hypothetical protein
MRREDDGDPGGVRSGERPDRGGEVRDGGRAWVSRASPVGIIRRGVFRLDPGRCSFYVPPMIQGSLFPASQPAVADDEVIDALRTAIARGGSLPRSADLLLCGLCARYLADELRAAGLEVVRRPPAECDGFRGG